MSIRDSTLCIDPTSKITKVRIYVDLDKLDSFPLNQLYSIWKFEQRERKTEAEKTTNNCVEASSTVAANNMSDEEQIEDDMMLFFRRPRLLFATKSRGTSVKAGEVKVYESKLPQAYDTLEDPSSSEQEVDDLVLKKTANGAIKIETAGDTVASSDEDLSSLVARKQVCPKPSVVASGEIDSSDEDLQSLVNSKTSSLKRSSSADLGSSGGESLSKEANKPAPPKHSSSNKEASSSVPSAVKKHSSDEEKSRTSARPSLSDKSPRSGKKLDVLGAALSAKSTVSRPKYERRSIKLIGETEKLSARPNLKRDPPTVSQTSPKKRKTTAIPETKVAPKVVGIDQYLEDKYSATHDGKDGPMAVSCESKMTSAEQYEIPKKTRPLNLSNYRNSSNETAPSRTVEREDQGRNDKLNGNLKPRDAMDRTSSKDTRGLSTGSDASKSQNRGSDLSRRSFSRNQSSNRYDRVSPRGYDRSDYERISPRYSSHREKEYGRYAYSSSRNRESRSESPDRTSDRKIRYRDGSPGRHARVTAENSRTRKLEGKSERSKFGTGGAEPLKRSKISPQNNISHNRKKTSDISQRNGGLENIQGPKASKTNVHAKEPSTSSSERSVKKDLSIKRELSTDPNRRPADPRKKSRLPPSTPKRKAEDSKLSSNAEKLAKLLHGVNGKKINQQKVGGSNPTTVPSTNTSSTNRANGSSLQIVPKDPRSRSKVPSSKTPTDPRKKSRLSPQQSTKDTQNGPLSRPLNNPALESSKTMKTGTENVKLQPVSDSRPVDPRRRRRN